MKYVIYTKALMDDTEIVEIVYGPYKEEWEAVRDLAPVLEAGVEARILELAVL